MTLENIVASVNGVLTDYVMVITLLLMALYFSIATRGVQFRMIGEMCRLLVKSGSKGSSSSRHHHSGFFKQKTAYEMIW